MMVRDLTSKLMTSSDYDAPCQHFLSSLESTSTTGIVEDHFINILSTICHHCYPLGPQDISEKFNAFVWPEHDNEDSDELTEGHSIMMGMRRGLPPVLLGTGRISLLSLMFTRQ